MNEATIPMATTSFSTVTLKKFAPATNLFG